MSHADTFNLHEIRYYLNYRGESVLNQSDRALANGNLPNRCRRSTQLMLSRKSSSAPTSTMCPSSFAFPLRMRHHFMWFAILMPDCRSIMFFYYKPENIHAVVCSCTGYFNHKYVYRLYPFRIFSERLACAVFTVLTLHLRLHDLHLHMISLQHILEFHRSVHR